MRFFAAPPPRGSPTEPENERLRIRDLVGDRAHGFQGPRVAAVRVCAEDPWTQIRERGRDVGGSSSTPEGLGIHAQLLHEREAVDEVTVLDDLPVLVTAREVGDLELHVVARRGDAHELALVGCAHPKA